MNLRKPIVKRMVKNFYQERAGQPYTPEEAAEELCLAVHQVDEAIGELEWEGVVHAGW